MPFHMGNSNSTKNKFQTFIIGLLIEDSRRPTRADTVSVQPCLHASLIWFLLVKSAFCYLRVPSFLSVCGSAALYVISSQRVDVRDVVPWVAVQRLLQAKLVQMMSDETDGTTKNEKTVKAAETDQIVGLGACERPTRAKHVDEAHGDATIDIQDQIRTLFLW